VSARVVQRHYGGTDVFGGIVSDDSRV
jgi:hypothetical protein